MHRIDEGMRWRIVTLHVDAGWSYNRISNHFAVSKSTVRDQIKRFVDTNNVKDRPRSGRPKKLTERIREYLRQNSTNNPIKS